MNQERIYQVLLGPHVSEKTSTSADKYGQVAFKVAVTANKKEIKQAVEFLVEVKVDAVQTVKVKGKTKRFGQTEGRRKDWKKAYVTLAEGHDIDVLGGEG